MNEQLWNALISRLTNDELINDDKRLILILMRNILVAGTDVQLVACQYGLMECLHNLCTAYAFSDGNSKLIYLILFLIIGTKEIVLCLQTLSNTVTGNSLLQDTLWRLWMESPFLGKIAMFLNDKALAVIVVILHTLIQPVPKRLTELYSSSGGIILLRAIFGQADKWHTSEGHDFEVLYGGIHDYKLIGLE